MLFYFSLLFRFSTVTGVQLSVWVPKTIVIEKAFCKLSKTNSVTLVQHFRTHFGDSLLTRQQIIGTRNLKVQDFCTKKGIVYYPNKQLKRVRICYVINTQNEVRLEVANSKTDVGIIALAFQNSASNDWF